MSKQLLQATTDFIQEYETRITDLQGRITELTVERDYYKEISAPEDPGHLYLLEYFEDNGEGRDTSICFGVFSSKSNALKNKWTLLRKHKIPNNLVITKHEATHLSPNMSEIDVYHVTGEEYCETYTDILGIASDQEWPTSAYPVKFKIDELKFTPEYIRHY